MAEFVQTQQAKKGTLVWRAWDWPMEDRKRIAAEILPTLRGEELDFHR
jgi:hypothetical protein